ncbi:MAG: peptidoglycan DD-metalloendopeptidase family protein [Chromatiales bacterium]|jgi:murein DD-endopeptidase MepM/ murein hydrolase activator NlpD
MTKDYKFLAEPRPRRRRLARSLLAVAVPAVLVAGGLYAYGALAKLDASARPSAAVAGRPVSLPLALPGQSAPREEEPADAGPTIRAPAPREPAADARPAEGAEPEQAGVPQASLPPGPVGAGEAGASAEAEGRWLEREIRSGDSLARIFQELGLSAGLLHRITHSGERARALADIRPGETLRARLTTEDDLLELVLERSPVSSLRILREGDGFRAEQVERDVEGRVAEISGTIEDSLYVSALEAGLSERLIMELANIFGWDIDFALEIRSGDQFRVVYEEEFLDGEKLGDGPILAAEFVNRGRVIRAVRYENEAGDADYYTPDGKSMRKAFLRAPVDFRRISSRFQRERYHPILGKRRPHRGVDYAAATGTPVRASGDGKVVHVGRKGGYGKAVMIQHGQQYTTLYGHLNGYRRGIKQGSRVKQGQIIGYVGMTGLATGPHLHYEFRVNGVHRDPLTVKLPEAEPIAARYRADFERKAAPLVARLDTLGRKTMVAAAN